jgi:hypothetical protein
MKRCIVLVALLVATPAFAQQQPQHYTLTVTEPELNLIGKALGKMPFEEVSSLVNNIIGQVHQQQAAAKPKPDAEKAPLADKPKTEDKP